MDSVFAYILALVFLIGQSNAIHKKVVCDGIIFHQVYYDKKLLIGNLGRPYNLVYHRYSGLLFFSHTIHIDQGVDFKIMACHLENKVCTDINEVKGGYAVAYDYGNDDIYMGGHEGIYKYNFLTNKAEFFAESGVSIWGLFIRRNFYYIQYPSQKLFVYKSTRFYPVAEAINQEIDNFFVSKFGDIYFSNKTALYKISKPDVYVNAINDDLVIRQIVDDSYGDVYFCASDGIYIEKIGMHALTKLADIDQAFGLTFDEHDNPIYSDKDCVYRLVPSQHASICYDALLSQYETKVGKHIAG